MNVPIELYTDGSARNNPGPAGLAYVIRYYTPAEGDEMPEPQNIEGSQGFRVSTNNRMEIMAGIYGLRKIVENVSNGTFKEVNSISLQTDSEYFCKAVVQGWIAKWQNNNWMTSSFGGKKPKPVKNRDLWEEFTALQNQLKAMGITLNMTHIAGHAGHEWNERCDQLATAAADDTTNSIRDEVYEKSASNY
jgi:ribonuclease HI